MTPSPVQPKNSPFLRWLSLAVAASLALGSAAVAAPSPGASPPLPLPEAVRNAARRWSAETLAPRCRLRHPSEKEMTQFHSELRRRGWPARPPALIPTRYDLRGASLYASSLQFATFYGDVDGDGQEDWVVGYRFDSPTGEDASDERVRVVVFQKDSEEIWRAAWRSPALGYDLQAPEYNLLEVTQGLDSFENLRLPLALVDVDGDGVLEIYYHCASAQPEMGSLPGVFRFQQGRWSSVAPQADRFSLQDVDGDGRLEAVTGSRYIGYGGGADDVPRVWRWNGRQFHDASTEFPEYYGALAKRYTKFVDEMTGAGRPLEKANWERAIRKALSLAAQRRATGPDAGRK